MSIADGGGDGGTTVFGGVVTLSPPLCPTAVGNLKATRSPLQSQHRILIDWSLLVVCQERFTPCINKLTKISNSSAKRHAPHQISPSPLDHFLAALGYRSL